jgi:predicted small secreted protein
MRRSILFFLALALLAAGCDRDRGAGQDRALAARALKGALAYPGSSVVSISAGSDAAQVDLSTAAAVQDVAAWYRRALPLNGWEIHSDAVDPNGAVTIYADKGKRPLWITLRPNVGGPGSTYTLIGAIAADSIK